VKFLIQTINGEVKHDFSFTLLESISYHNWLNNNYDMKYNLSEHINYEGYIPIGSVEFVTSYLQKYYNLTPKPKNIPEELLDNRFTGRKVINGTNKDITGLSFVKSNDKIKSFTNICDEAPEGNYQISELIDIESEYRCFVYKGELVGLKNYSGDFTIFPDITSIKQMIKQYITAPTAYTLDVGISNGETIVIEVHDFFSCGFYGFSEHKIIPFMFSRWFSEYINYK